MSYKSALISNISNTSNASNKEKKQTFWEDASIEEDIIDEYSNEWEKKQYNTFKILKKSPTFKRKFAIFAENILCLNNTDTEKGCRIDLRFTRYWSEDHSSKSGVKKGMIGLWFLYRQDGITYSCVYECDNLKDPRSGWFYQWDHAENCCGYSCDYYGCPYNYPKKLKKLH